MKTTTAWTPNDKEEPYVSTIGRMALDALASNGVNDRATFIFNLRGLANCLENLDPMIGKPKSEAAFAASGGSATAKDCIEIVRRRNNATKNMGIRDK